MNKILALAILCMPTFFFNFLAGALTTEKNADAAGPLGDLGLTARVLITQYLR